MVKKYIAILFLALYTLNTTELGQVLKLPILVSHFFEHLHDNERLEQTHHHDLAHEKGCHDREGADTFIDFIVLHYGTNSHTQNEHKDRHRQLPFKSHDSCHQFQSLSFIFPSSYQFITNVYFIKMSFSPTDKDFFIPSQFSCNIWQPPKA